MASQQHVKPATLNKPAARQVKNTPAHPPPHMRPAIGRPSEVARPGHALPIKRKPFPKQVEILRRESGAGNSGCVVAGGPECSGSEGTETARSWQQAEGWDEKFEEEDMGMEVEDDDVLRSAQILAAEEVIKRRMRRVRKLLKLYRSQYWALLEEMRAKYRKFYLRHGRGGWRESLEPESSLPYSGRQEPHAPDKPANATLHCAAPGPCHAKPLALSVFCPNHILLEPRQKLYKPCTFAERSSGGQCGRPVICAVIPLLCPVHMHESERQSQRVKKRGGGNPPTRDPQPGAAKQGPKVHLIFAEYVKAIQRKRKALLSAERAMAKAARDVTAAETTQRAEAKVEAGRDGPSAAGAGVSSGAAPAVAPVQQTTLDPSEAEAWAVTGKLVEEVDVPSPALFVAPIPG